MKLQYPPKPDDASCSTYIATSRDMFDIVLRATARRDMAEVQLFVYYLNLQTGRETDRQARKSTDGRERDERKKEKKRQKKRRKERKKQQRTADQPAT